MDKLNLTPNEIAKKVRKPKPTEMDILPLLASFSGRIGRRQFLLWYLPLWLLPLPVAIFLNYSLAGALNLFLLYPLFALTTKRCHDLGSAGWFGCFQLIPGIGGIAIICAGCGMNIGEFGDNRYGPSIYKR
jgi:uncharacterized membrane protein YhaH (DUF805 family)